MKLKIANKLELEHVLQARLGNSVDLIQTQQVFQKLKSIQLRIDELINDEKYEEVAKIRDEYKNLMSKADQNLEAFSQIKQYNAYIEQAFQNVFKFEGDPSANDPYPFPYAEIGSELSKVVEEYVQVDNLNLKTTSHSVSNSKVKGIIGVQKIFNHKTDVTCILSLKNGMIVSGSSDSNIRIWDPKTGK